MRGRLSVRSELHCVRMCLFTLYCFPSTLFGGRGELGDRRGPSTEVQKGNLIPMWSMAIERLFLPSAFKTGQISQPKTGGKKNLCMSPTRNLVYVSYITLYF